jgi:hypothetical protein
VSDALVEQYAKKIKPLLPLAKRAYGSRAQVTPAHEASREYTRLLAEFYENGGSLVALSEKLDVAYSGMRRRVFTAKLPPSTMKKGRVKYSEAEISAAAKRVTKARDSGGAEAYHSALAAEYSKGVSLAALAEELGLSSAAPLYYGVQRAALRESA